MDEARKEATESPYIPPPSVVVDTTIAARIVEETIRNYFNVPKSQNLQVTAMSKVVAHVMKDHFLSTHRLYWTKEVGNA